MVKVIGVRFRTAGKIYFFDPLHFEIKRGDHVIVETARGIEYGTVMSEAREVSEDKVVQPLKPVIRIANERDAEQEKSNRQKEKEAFKICLDKSCFRWINYSGNFNDCLVPCPCERKDYKTSVFCIRIFNDCSFPDGYVHNDFCCEQI